MGLVSALQVEEEVKGREKQLDAILRDKKTIKANYAWHVTGKNVYCTTSVSGSAEQYN